MDKQTVISKIVSLIANYGKGPTIRKIADAGSSTLVAWHLITASQDQSMAQAIWPWALAAAVQLTTWVVSMIGDKNWHEAPPPFVPPTGDTQ